MPHNALVPRGLREEKNSRWRGGDVSRLEGLADGVFAVALPGVPALSGLIYFLMGPVQGVNGYLVGRAVEAAGGRGGS